MEKDDRTACSLADRDCIPCRGGVPALSGDELSSRVAELGGGWEVVEGHHLTKVFRFRDFAGALAFTNRVGALAEEVGHHPTIELGWGRAAVTIWTHKIDGLADADFIFAAKVNRLFPDSDS